MGNFLETLEYYGEHSLGVGKEILKNDPQLTSPYIQYVLVNACVEKQN